MEFQSQTIALHSSMAPCPILVIPHARLGIDKYRFSSHCFDSARVSNHIRYQNGGDKYSTHLALRSGITVIKIFPFAMNGKGVKINQSHNQIN